MINKSLKELAQALAAKQISSVELSTLFLDRIERLNPDINAFVTVDREKTLAMARAADARIAAGTAGPLTGIPVAQKDIFCAEGWTTTCGSKMLANFVSPYDATVIRKMHSEAGMVSLGKTNMDEFAMGSSNETSFFGQVKNPWDRTRVPGGSSGGSAAAVAARLAPAATGTDTGGSIRQPAALCNLTGLKPTYGVVSRYGMIAFASSLDQGGPMAASAEDCALLLNTMVGFDERDSTSLDRPAEDYARDLDKPLNGLRIGLPKEFFGEGCDAEVMAAVRTAIAEYEKTLITPNSRFDKWLKGDDKALTAQEIEGYQRFKMYRCSSCHVGKSVGGQSFEYMDLKKAYFEDRGNPLVDRASVVDEERERAIPGLLADWNVISRPREEVDCMPPRLSELFEEQNARERVA